MSSPSSSAPRHLAVIGTAGRDRTRPMDSHLWDAMLADLAERVQPSDVLVSGGAAWADHLAVFAYLEGWVTGLQLFLPAPLRVGINGPAFLETGRGRCSGSAANYYHQRFREVTGIASLEQLAEVRRRGAQLHEQPSIAGFGGMFARNRLVARCATEAIAYTWGQDSPADGGTADTWRAMENLPRTHVPLDPLRQLIDVTAEHSGPNHLRPGSRTR